MVKVMPFTETCYQMIKETTQDGEHESKSRFRGLQRLEVCDAFSSQPCLAGLYDGHSSETFASDSDRRYIDVTRPKLHTLLRQNKQLITSGLFVDVPISFPELGEA